MHDYFGIDDSQVWNVVHNELPRLRAHIAGIIDELESSNEGTAP